MGVVLLQFLPFIDLSDYSHLIFRCFAPMSANIHLGISLSMITCVNGALERM